MGHCIYCNFMDDYARFLGIFKFSFKYDDMKIWFCKYIFTFLACFVINSFSLHVNDLLFETLCVVSCIHSRYLDKVKIQNFCTKSSKFDGLVRNIRCRKQQRISKKIMSLSTEMPLLTGIFIKYVIEF